MLTPKNLWTPSKFIIPENTLGSAIAKARRPYITNVKAGSNTVPDHQRVRTALEVVVRRQQCQTGHRPSSVLSHHPAHVQPLGRKPTVVLRVVENLQRKVRRKWGRVIWVAVQLDRVTVWIQPGHQQIGADVERVEQLFEVHFGVRSLATKTPTIQGDPKK